MAKKQGATIDQLAYQKVVAGLFEFIASAEYDRGGWLPAGRDMAKRFDVSHRTYCKALKFIEKEGAVRSFPPTGFYVSPKELRFKKIGIIVDGGDMSPFIRTALPAAGMSYTGNLTAAFEYVIQQGMYVQLIQASHLDQLQAVAQSYGVIGVIWMNPPQKATDQLESMVRSRIPVIVVKDDEVSSTIACPVVTYDHTGMDQERARFMIKRGHKCLGYMGPYERAQAHGLPQLFEQEGIEFGPQYCHTDIARNTKRFMTNLQANPVTGILGPHSEQGQAYLLRELASLPANEQPEVLITNHKHRHPFEIDQYQIRIVWMNRELSTLPGFEAARRLIAHIRDGDPLQSTAIGFY